MKNDRLRDLIKNKAQEAGNISYDELRVRYAAERFLIRLQQSSYSDNLILKGGFLLGTIYQIDQRTTKDLDIMIKDLQADHENIEQMVNEIIAIDLGDGIKFEVLDLQDSQKDRVYEGYRAKMKMHMDGNTNLTFDLDIGVGDVITPKPKLAVIPLLFNEKKGDEEYIGIYSYPLETVLAEKLETILSLGESNSRMKDFYDIHLILNDPNLPTIELLYNAFFNTWTFRHPKLEFSEESFDDWKSIVESISDNAGMENKMWKKYAQTRPYVKGINWKETLKQLAEFLKELKIVYLQKI